MGVDKAQLVAWLLERAKARNVLLAAVYAGLADRVRRGDFDERDA
ncbi:MAG TPA: hypothetical protein VIL55_01435 [Naasia sp.]